MTHWFLLNSLVNFILKLLGERKISLSERVKDTVKQAAKSINDFEKTATEIAIENKYDYVICGAGAKNKAMEESILHIFNVVMISLAFSLKVLFQIIQWKRKNRCDKSNGFEDTRSTKKRTAFECSL